MPSVAELAPRANFQENVGNDGIPDWFRHAHDGLLMDRYNSELFLSGLERAGTGGDEGDLLIMAHRGQLERYQSRWSRLEFASSDDIPFNPGDSYDIVEGVIVWRVLKEVGTVRFLQIGASTRGIPRVEWKMQCPEIFLGFKIDPTSNIFVTLTPQNNWSSATITLRTMTDGLPHPKAHQHIIEYDLSATFASSEWCDELHINGSRLGVVFRPADPEDNRFFVVVWNWTTGEMVLRLENERRKAIKFLDEYKILVWEDDDNFLDIYDTSRAPEAGWALSNRALRLGLPDAIYFDVRMHSGSNHGSKPAHLEGVVPFFAADSAKIMIINTITDSDLTKEALGTSIVVFIEDILRTFQMMPFGSVMHWEDWGEMTTAFDFRCLPSQTEDERQCFVAGSRFISPPLGCDLPGFRRLEVYDFNPHYIEFAQATGQQSLPIMGDGGLKYTKSQIIVPWREDKTTIAHHLVHLTEDHVIIEDANYPGGSGICSRALSV
ncbi:hypothetical protein BDM02DRAFT_3117826 [Thelephora ganbajun]|uniref:Uncharacterized protein n=1 Tax=Thelephora ganbajun TaxID=370292 RepID=A0ACB6ZBK0_THEGA|nr:hypothetical protein BDM02DRAFT_3117826 [Thelephora ganbajun]